MKLTVTSAESGRISSIRTGSGPGQYLWKLTFEIVNATCSAIVNLRPVGSVSFKSIMDLTLSFNLVTKNC